jgi:hypothetical protein
MIMRSRPGLRIVPPDDQSDGQSVATPVVQSHAQTPETKLFAALNSVIAELSAETEPTLRRRSDLQQAGLVSIRRYFVEKSAERSERRGQISRMSQLSRSVGASTLAHAPRSTPPADSHGDRSDRELD